MGRNGRWSRCVLCELEHRKKELAGEKTEPPQPFEED
jgi:hypothetical protein